MSIIILEEPDALVKNVVKLVAREIGILASDNSKLGVSLTAIML